MLPKRNIKKPIARKSKTAERSKNVLAPISSVGVLYRSPLITGPSVDPFPPRLIRSLRYQYTTTLSGTGTANTFGTAVTFNLNSVFQPNSGGHQPYGFDTLATLYDRYKVHSVDVDILACYTGGIQNSFVGVIMLPPGEAATIAGSTVEIVGEKPMAFTAPIVGGTGTGVADIQQKFVVAQCSCLSPVEFAANVEDYAALVSASPSRIPRLEIAVADFTTTTTASIKFRCSLIYHVEFYDRVILAQS
jgi:hypothetical protein